MGQDLSDALAFYTTNRNISAKGLSYRVKELAFLHYLGLPLKAIHEYATQRDYYQASYPAFTRWVRRNVNFKALCDQYEAEFQAQDPRTRQEKDTDTLVGEAKASNFSPRSSDSTPSTVKDKCTPKVVKESPEETLKRWLPTSFEDQLKDLGLCK